MFDRIRDVDTWTFNTVVEPEEWEQFDDQLSKAVDGDAGGEYDPSATLSIAKLHCPTWPAVPNAVVPKTYLDGVVGVINSDITAIEGDIDALEAAVDDIYDVQLSQIVDGLDGLWDSAIAQGDRLDDIEAALDAVFSEESAAVTYSGLTNLSSINATTDFKQLIHTDTHILHSLTCEVTASASGTKSFEVAVPHLNNNFAHSGEAIGHGATFIPAAAGAVCQVYAVTSTDRVRVEWHDTVGSGSYVLRVMFTYTK